MDLRFVSASLLLLGTYAFAQTPAPAPTPIQPAIPGQPAAPGATKTPGQDPDKPKPTAQDQIKDLTAERERLAREIAYVQDRAKHAKTILAQKFASKQPEFKAIDAGTNAPLVQPMTPTQPRQARVATPEELANQGNDTLLVVNGRPIPERSFDELMKHLATSPASGDEAMRAQRALFDLIRIEAIAATFGDSEAQERTAGILVEIEGGKSVAEFAKSAGTVPGASPEGKLEVTRNSVFGPRFEQVAFSTEAGKRARPFRNANGFVILQVDSFAKGETPEQDKVVCTAAQVSYSPDPQAMMKAHSAVNTGQVEVLVRDQKVLAMLPEMFRQPMAPVMAAPVPQPRIDTTMLQQQLQRINAEIGSLSAKTDEASKAKLQDLNRQYSELKTRLRAAESGQAMPGEIKQDTDAVKPQIDATAVRKQLEQVAAEMAALQGKTDDASKAKLQALSSQYTALKRQLQAAESGGNVAPDEIKADPSQTKPPVKKN